MFRDGLGMDFGEKRTGTVINGAGTSGLHEGLVVGLKDGSANDYNWYSAANAFQGAWVAKSGANGVLAQESATDAGDADIVLANRLISMVAGIPTRFLAGSVWLMNRKILAAIRQVRDANGQSLFQANYAGNGQNPMTMELLGFPVILADQMPGLDSTKATIPLGFGNLGEYYKVFPRRDLVLETYRKPDLIQWYLKERFAAAKLHGQAFQFYRAGA